MSEDENNGLQQRINKLGAAKSAALARVAELEAAAQESADRLAGYDALASRVASLEGDLANARQRWSALALSMVGRGVSWHTNTASSKARNPSSRHGSMASAPTKGLALRCSGQLPHRRQPWHLPQHQPQHQRRPSQCL